MIPAQLQEQVRQQETENFLEWYSVGAPQIPDVFRSNTQQNIDL